MALFLAASLVAHPLSAVDYLLPLVTVDGHYGGPIIFNPYVPIVTCSPFCLGEVQAMDLTAGWQNTYTFDVVSVAKRANAMRDVRCVGNTDAKTTMSTADLTDRWLATQSAFTNVKNFKNLSNFVKGLPKGPMHNGRQTFIYAITYADNGSEQWMVLAHHDFTSASIVDNPLPDSLRLGTGQIEPKSCDALKGSA